MYPRNAASPNQIAIGAVVQISDGAVQTSGCTVRILPQGGAEGDGAGTTAYSTDGVVLYTPTQGETNYTSFVLIAKKTGCIPASATVVTTASATAGNVIVGDKTGFSLHADYDAAKTAASQASVDTIDGIVDAILADTGTDGVVLPQAQADKVWGTAARALTDKAGFSLSAAGVQAVWDAATAALTTAGSIGKALVDLVGRVVGTLLAGNHTAQSGDAYGIANSGVHGNAALKTLIDTANTGIADVPTVAEFEARTLPAADYFNAATDEVTPTAASKTGYAIGVGGIAANSFAAGAIDAAAIAANAIGASELADGAIDNATLAADVVVAANVKKINDTTLTGNGSTTPWGPA